MGPSSLGGFAAIGCVDEALQRRYVGSGRRPDTHGSISAVRAAARDFARWSLAAKAARFQPPRVYLSLATIPTSSAGAGPGPFTAANSRPARKVKWSMKKPNSA